MICAVAFTCLSSDILVGQQLNCSTSSIIPFSQIGVELSPPLDHFSAIEFHSSVYGTSFTSTVGGLVSSRLQIRVDGVLVDVSLESDPQLTADMPVRSLPVRSHTIERRCRDRGRTASTTDIAIASSRWSAADNAREPRELPHAWRGYPAAALVTPRVHPLSQSAFQRPPSPCPDEPLGAAADGSQLCETIRVYLA